MKKMNISKFLVAGLAIATVFSSCKKKEDKNEPVPNGSAKVKGLFRVNLNKTNDNPTVTWDAVPAGTVLVFTYESDELSNATPAKEVDFDVFRTSSVSMVADGSSQTYEINLPCNNNPVTYSVTFSDFEANETTFKNGIDGDTETKRAIFSASTSDITVVNGQTVIRDITYSAGGDM